MRWEYFLTRHAEERFRERAGPVVFDTQQHRMVPVSQIELPRLIAIANEEIARGELVTGEARMRIATDSVQRYGAFSADDRLIAFDDHGWILRNTVVASFFELDSAVLQGLHWPLESLRIITHQSVCEDIIGTRILGECVVDDTALDDVMRRVIRLGVRVSAPVPGTARFVGPFEAERIMRKAVTFVPMTITCDVAPGRDGNIVQNVECRLQPFVAEDYAPTAPPALSRAAELRAPVDGVAIRAYDCTFRIHLGRMPDDLALTSGRTPSWWESLVVVAAKGARVLTETGMERFFPKENGTKWLDASMAFALDLPDARLVEPKAKTLVVLARMDPDGTGQVRRWIASPLAMQVLAVQNYVTP